MLKPDDSHNASGGEGRGVPNGIPLRDSDVTKTSRDQFCRTDSEDAADTDPVSLDFRSVARDLLPNEYT